MTGHAQPIPHPCVASTAATRPRPRTRTPTGRHTAAMNNVAPRKPRPAGADQIAGILQQATTAANTVRGIVHDTLGQDAIPAPELYPILGQLEDLAAGLDQALRQLAGSL